jgi:CDP-4-dehydro-6-deoxyglucose reductase, E3
MPLPPTLDVRLVDKKTLSPSVCELTFERVDGSSFIFEAGQWVSLVLPLPAGELRRAYSIASPPSDTPRFDLAVTHVSGGPGSGYLHDMRPGTTLKAIGPQGFFTRPIDRSGPSLFIATGTGVTPLRSMMHAALESGDVNPLWLVFGVRTEEDILYLEELEELARERSNVRVIFTLSRGSDSWQGRRGYVQAHVSELWNELEALGLGKTHAYACGLQKMVGAVRDLLRKQLKVPREQVHAERYD